MCNGNSLTMRYSIRSFILSHEIKFIEKRDCFAFGLWRGRERLMYKETLLSTLVQFNFHMQFCTITEEKNSPQIKISSHFRNFNAPYFTIQRRDHEIYRAEWFHSKYVLFKRLYFFLSLVMTHRIKNIRI